jgi:hypothetical protein
LGIPRRADNVIFEVVEGKAVLVAPNGDELITLNPLGTMVWETLDGERDANGIAELLRGEFADVPMERLEADVQAFLDQLRSLDLVDIRS